jgi:hypothetical protein
MQKRGAISLERPKDNATLPHTSHCSEYDNVSPGMFDTICLIPTPTDVIATTSGKCVNKLC